MNTTPKIRILVAQNPKKPGSKAYARFALYKDGMTVTQFLTSGGTRSDLHYDVDHKFIDITTLDNRSDGSAPNAKPSSNRDAAVKRIKALLAKTEANGCTEEEAFAAAAKAGELMDKYGIESSEADIREETCVTGIHGGERLKSHESQWISNAVGRYCDCRVWRKTRTGQIVFFGLPADVEVATYIMRVVEGAMNRSFKAFKKSEAYPHYDEARRVRATYMNAMATRVTKRLDEMHAARHTEDMKTTTGTSLVLVKTQVVAEQFDALGMKLGKSKSVTLKQSSSAAAWNAGKAAGDKVHLGTGISGHTSKRIS
jgi:Protein of unknown function (DUF2786)